MQCILPVICEKITLSGGIMASLSIILGGARSGKSTFAEGLVRATDLPKTYIATAQPFDDEMKSKIAQHRADRGEGWKTVEEPLDIVGALANVPAGSIVLIDCLTLWLSNHLLVGNDIDIVIDGLLVVLANAPFPVVCVSNEVGMGLVPDTALGREFRDAQGLLNRQLAAKADLAVFVVAGLPIPLKGTLP